MRKIFGVLFRLSLVFLVLLGVVGGILAYLSYMENWAIFEVSVAEVQAKYYPRFCEKREQLKRLVESLPPPGELAESVAPLSLDPPLKVQSSSSDGNFTGAMDFQCLKPDAVSFPREPFSMVVASYRWHGDLVRMIRESGPESLSLYGHRKGADRAQAYDEVLAMPYFVICRTLKYTKPLVLENEKEFLPGEVQVEAILMDLRDEKWKACVRVHVKSVAERISVKKGLGQSYAESTTMNELAELARQAMNKKFESLIGQNR